VFVMQHQTSQIYWIWGEKMGQFVIYRYAKYWVDQLNLQQHPFMEETYFRDTFMDTQLVQVKRNNNDDKKIVGVDDFSTLTRPASTLTYYLHLPAESLGESTLFYRSRCSSISMHFYQGLPISLYYFTEGGKTMNDVNSISSPIYPMNGTKGSLK